MALQNGLTYSIRNTEDGQTVSFSGDGEFCIGLTLDETIACSKQGSSGSGCTDPDQEDIVVPLVMLTVWRTSGVTVCPASRDLKCVLNGEDIGMEAHVIPGNKIEVGDKVLELLSGHVPKPQRRHLPPTPGVPFHPTPPPKPQRTPDKLVAENELQSKDTAESRSAMRDWCLIQLPNSENELLQQTKDPDQLAGLASSYLTHHVTLHTDIVMTAELADKIFKMMQEVAYHRRDILHRFLCDVISEVVVENEENGPEMHHAAVTSLLVEILRQFLDPGYLVLLCLQLLRAISHIPGNVITMVSSQTTAAVLGSMAAYRDDEDVQNYCLNILAKMATYMPAVLEKPKMRESSIDLVSMAMTLHMNNVTVVQSGIRTLANIAATLHSLAFAAMIDSPNPDLRAYMVVVMGILEYLYNNTLALVRNALARYHTDLTVKTDGRRFLFECAKMDQLRRQCVLWEAQPDLVRGTIYTYTSAEVDEVQSRGGSKELRDKCREGNKTSHSNHSIESSDESSSTSGILKKTRSYENLKTPDRRVSFVNEEDLPAHRSSSSSSVESDLSGNGGKSISHSRTRSSESPDIQIISRNRICPLQLSSVETSSEGESAQPTPSEDAIPPVKPARRPITAPLVHINSHSDSDAEGLCSATGMHSNNKAVDHSSENNRDPSVKEITNMLVDSSEDTTCPPGDSSSSFLSRQSSSPPVPPPRPSHHPVSLIDFRYSAADIMFMKRLLSVQVACHVCSCSIRGQDPQALKLIDRPLSQVLARPGIPPAIGQFAVSQLKEESTLMDLDPGTVISVIDAVRYKMLVFDLVKKSLQILIQSLGVKVHPKMFALTSEVIWSVVKDTALSPIVADQEFVQNLEKDLASVRNSVRDPLPITTLIEEFKTMIRSRQAEQDS